MLFRSDRERRTKGALARLHSDRALERWNGPTGMGKLSYRWETVRTILKDIRQGAGRELDPA